MMGVTYLQRDALGFIEAYIATHGGVSPSLREIADHMDISLGNAWRLVNALTVRGHIKRGIYRARSLEVVPPGRESFYVWDDKIKALVPWVAS